MGLAKSEALLIEDTENSNSFFSLASDAVISKYHSSKILLFWRSPCFELTTRSRVPIISLTPTYLPGSPHTTFSSSPILESIMLRSVSQSDTLMGLVSSKMAGRSSISLSELNLLCVDGIYLGRAISSWLIRIDPTIGISRRASVQSVLSYSYLVLRSLCSLRSIFQHFNITHSFFTETVYLTSAINDYLSSFGVSQIYFNSNDGPLLINAASHLRHMQSFGPSPRIHVSHLYRQTETSPSPHHLFKLLSSRIRGSSTLNNSKHKSQVAVDHMCKNIASSISIDFIDTPNCLTSLTLNNDYSEIFVFYLHATTDGSYQKGFSGFPTAVDFFTHIVKLFKNSESSHRQSRPLFLLKPHPNLFWGEESPYISHSQKVITEREVFCAHLNELLSTISSFSYDAALISCLTPQINLFRLKRAWHCSHHGTALTEAYPFNLPIIASSSSQLSLLPCINNVLMIDASSDILPDINSFTLKMGRSSFSLIKRRLLESNKVTPYTSSFAQNYSLLVGKSPYNSRISNLNKFVFDSQCCWNRQLATNLEPSIRPLLASLESFCELSRMHS